MLAARVVNYRGLTWNEFLRLLRGNLFAMHHTSSRGEPLRGYNNWRAEILKLNNCSILYPILYLKVPQVSWNFQVIIYCMQMILRFSENCISQILYTEVFRLEIDIQEVHLRNEMLV